MKNYFQLKVVGQVLDSLPILLQDSNMRHVTGFRILIEQAWGKFLWNGKVGLS